MEAEANVAIAEFMKDPFHDPMNDVIDQLGA